MAEIEKFHDVRTERNWEGLTKGNRAGYNETVAIEVEDGNKDYVYIATFERNDTGRSGTASNYPWCVKLNKNDLLKLAGLLIRTAREMND